MIYQSLNSKVNELFQNGGSNLLASTLELHTWQNEHA